MRFLRLRRLWHGSGACHCPTCPHRQIDSPSVWCREHTDAIMARGNGRFEECALRLGARRWLRQAEVELELERQSVEVLEQILAMTPQERSYPWSRALWDRGAIKLSDRVDELLELLGEPAEPSPPDRVSSV